MSEEMNYTFENEQYRKTYWHTCSHILVIRNIYSKVRNIMIHCIIYNSLKCVYVIFSSAIEFYVCYAAC